MAARDAHHSGSFLMGVHHFLVTSHVCLIEKTMQLCFGSHREVFPMSATFWLFLVSVLEKEGFICIFVWCVSVSQNKRTLKMCDYGVTLTSNFVEIS